MINVVPIKQVLKWLGHSTFSSTAGIYAHFDYKNKEGSSLRRFYSTPKSVLQKRAACIGTMQFKGLGFPNKHFEIGF